MTATYADHGVYPAKWDLDAAKNRETDTHVYFLSGPFSQWFKSDFTDQGIKLFDWDDGKPRTFKTAEQFMMFHKAKMFHNHDIAEHIMQTEDPAEQKALGRKVQGFDPSRWNEECVRVVATGNFYKFSQNPSLQEELLRTEGKILVEAADYDKIWGVGLRADDPRILDSAQWQGTNLLGDCLMAVRMGLQQKGQAPAAIVDAGTAAMSPAASVQIVRN